MAEALSRLCCLIIEDVYGSFLSTIYECLIWHGRSSAQQIAQRCRIPLRHVHSGVAALIQYRLVRHHTTFDGNPLYHADQDAAYALLRIGKLVNLVSEIHGNQAGKVIHVLADLGCASYEQLISQLSCSHAGSGRKDNQTHEDHRTSSHPKGSASWPEIVKQLIEHRYIVRLRPIHCKPTIDARNDIRDELRSRGEGITGKGKKGVAEFEERITQELQSRLDQSVSDKELRSKGLVNGHASVQASNTENASENPLILCLSFNVLLAAIRNETLLKTARKSLSCDADACLSAVLAAAENAAQRAGKQLLDSEINLTATDIIESLKALQLSKSMRTTTSSLTNGWHHEIASTTTDGTIYNHERASELVPKQLALLAEIMFDFIHHDQQAGYWCINGRQMGKFIREREILQLVGERLNPPVSRIVRILIEHGKLDEKSLQERGLLGAKELRRTLAQLHNRGFIELQEVPREPQRLPNRTMYYWFHDPQRARKVLLEELYQAISRTLEHLNLQRKSMATTLNKIERLETRDDEEELLGTGELEALKRWRRKELWLVAEIARLDDSVAILRDS